MVRGSWRGVYGRPTYLSTRREDSWDRGPNEGHSGVKDDETPGRPSRAETFWSPGVIGIYGGVLRGQRRYCLVVTDSMSCVVPAAP